MSPPQQDASASLAAYPGLWRLATGVELALCLSGWALGLPPVRWVHALQAQIVEHPAWALSAVGAFLALFLPTCLAYAVATSPERRRRGLSLDEVARLHELAPWGARRAGSPLARRLPPGVILAALVLTGAAWSMDPGAARGLTFSAGGALALLALAIVAVRTWRDASSAGL